MRTDDSPLPPPGLLRRLGALCYDGLLLLGLLFFATAVLLPFRGGQAFRSGDWGYDIYLIAVVFLFFGWFWTRDGQTLGMRAWKIRLTAAKGGPVTWRQSAWRFLPALLSLGLFYLGAGLWPKAGNWAALSSFGLLGLGFCWAWVDREKRCWHDLIAHTRMASLRGVRPPAAQSP
jgi:uncharacterized RDD family membrane protein YckC